MSCISGGEKEEDVDGYQHVQSFAVIAESRPGPRHHAVIENGLAAPQECSIDQHRLPASWRKHHRRQNFNCNIGPTSCFIEK